MKAMADLTFRDRLPEYRNQYNRLTSKEAKSRFLDRLQAAYGYERKSLNKRLTGNRRYKPHKGRSKVYGEDFEKAALALHQASGWMCAPYLKEAMPKLLADWEAVAGPVAPRIREQLLSAGESTFARLFRRHPGRHLRQGNRRSGANRLKALVVACPGKKIEDGRPGVFQIDSVAHGGGGPEPHFYSLDMTDAETQWCEFAFVWCRGAEATRDGLEQMVRRLPFAVRKIHPDGGGEYINSVFLEHVARFMPGTEVFRSRPSRPNDNCRVEQKNGSIIRGFLRDWRLDDASMQRELDWVAEQMALYVNLFTPSKRLLSKEPVDGKAVKYRFRYDRPRTPLERLKEADPDNPELERLDKLFRRTNSVLLLTAIKKKIASIVKRCSARRVQAGPGLHPSVSSHLTNGVRSF